MSTYVPIGSSPAGVAPGTAPLQAPVGHHGFPLDALGLDKARHELYQMSIGMLFASGAILISFWASFWFPIVLFFYGLIIALIQHRHTKDSQRVLSETCVVGPTKVFSSLRTLHFIGIFLDIVSAICSIAALIAGASNDFSFLRFVFQGICFAGCVAYSLLSWASAVRCATVDITVLAILSGAMAAPSAFLSTAAPMVGQAVASYQQHGAVTYGSVSNQPTTQGYGFSEGSKSSAPTPQ